VQDRVGGAQRLQRITAIERGGLDERRGIAVVERV
jgi:hypothetical protein